MLIFKIRNLTFVTFILFLSLIFNNSYSQKGYSSGYIVTNNLDTIRGQIDFEWPSKDVEVRLLNGGVEKSYTLTEIAAVFNEEKGLFVRRKVVLDMSSDQTALLLENGKDQLEEQELLIKVIVNSNVSFYYYRENIRNHYLIESPKSDGLQELIDQRRYTIQNNVKTIIRSKKFLGQLSYYLGECPEVGAKIKKLTGLNLKKLTGIIKQYNECLNHDIIYLEDKKETKVIFDLGIMAGISNTDFNLPNGFLDRDFISWVPDYIDFPSYTSFSGGLELRLGSTRNRHINFVLEGIYKSYELEVDYIDERLFLEDVNLKLSYRQFQFNFMPEYKFILDTKLTPFVQVGFGNAWMGNFESEKRTVRSNNTGVDIRDPFIGFLKNSEQNWIIGTGFSYNKASVNLRYQSGNGLFNTVKGSNTQTIFLLFSYNVL